MEEAEAEEAKEVETTNSTDGGHPQQPGLPHLLKGEEVSMADSLPVSQGCAHDPLLSSDPVRLRLGRFITRNCLHDVLKVFMELSIIWTLLSKLLQVLSLEVYRQLHHLVYNRFLMFPGVNKKPKKIKSVWHGIRGISKLSGRVNQAGLKLSAGFSNTVCWTS